MNVMMIAPGYPDEMPFFVRGLALEGAQVIGIGDQPEHDVPHLAARHLASYIRVPSLQDEDECMRVVMQWAKGKKIDRVICLWEPGVILAAKLREQLGAPGMSIEDTEAFRDKDLMKERVGKAGIRVPKHKSAKSAQGVRAAVKKIGYPVIVKPIAGAGSMDTYRVDNPEQLKEVIRSQLLQASTPDARAAPVEPVTPPEAAPDFLSNPVARPVRASKIGRVTASLPVQLAFRPGQKDLRVVRPPDR